MEWAQKSLIAPAIENVHLFTDSRQVDRQQDDPMVEPETDVKSVVQEEKSERSVEICTTADTTIMNPQINLTCILCQQSGEKRITGRLIPFQVNQFVHVNCAMWTAEVHEGTEDNVVSSELYNFFFAFKQFRQNKCSICDLKGATLICANHSVNRKCA